MDRLSFRSASHCACTSNCCQQAASSPTCSNLVPIFQTRPPIWRHSTTITCMGRRSDERGAWGRFRRFIVLDCSGRQSRRVSRACATLAQQIAGRILTTNAVLLETANTLARPKWRAQAVRFINRLLTRSDIEIVFVGSDLWQRGWRDYCSRPDKAWSLTDCISILVMSDNRLADALTTDNHFRQAGFRAILLEQIG